MFLFLFRYICVYFNPSELKEKLPVVSGNVTALEAVVKQAENEITDLHSEMDSFKLGKRLENHWKSTVEMDQ